MTSLILYGIPQCGTCKKVLQWLDDRQIPYTFVNLKDNPPTPDTIVAWVKALGSKPLRNTSGQSYRALGNDRHTWTEEQWMTAFAQDAMLLKRPIVVQQGKAIGTGFKETGWPAQLL